MEKEEIERYKKAGEIEKQVIEYARNLVKPGMPLLEIAEKIEAKIVELEAKPAFPINLSINEVAAHSTPSHDDKSTAKGLLKVDIGVHIEGYVADSAFSIDLEDSEENKNLIKAAEEALNSTLEIVNKKTTLREIGRRIEETIKSYKAHPIQNLSGHSIAPYLLHAGTTIPNVDNYQEYELEEGVFAIEPFATLGLGSVKNGKLSGIYHLEREGNVRDLFARDVLAYIKEEYKTLPFCSRWIVKKFGSRGILALKRIEDAGLLHHYPQLVETSGRKVAQAEHTILLTENEKIIITK